MEVELGDPHTHTHTYVFTHVKHTLHTLTIEIFVRFPIGIWDVHNTQHI